MGPGDDPPWGPYKSGDLGPQPPSGEDERGRPPLGEPSPQPHSPSRSLDNATVKISAKEYEYEIFRSPEEYLRAKLEPPRYDLPAKYTPKRAVVTVAVAPPPPDAGSQDGDEIHRRDVAPLKKSLAKRDQRIKELEGKLKTAEETGRRILERADFGEKILTNPVLLAKHICRGRETGEAVLAAISRTSVGEDLMYEFRTWAFNKGRRAMQSDVRAALEVSIDDGDLQRVLAVLPEEVPDPGSTPFSTTPEGQVLPVPLAEASAGPTAEDAVTPNAGQTAEGATGPGVEPSADHP
nr:leucine zipper putative tumor suppressor 2-like [Ipomoea batatas]